MSLFCANGAAVGCRLGVWDLTTSRVSQVPFWIGEGSSFCLFMGPFEPACFKDVHLMNPEAPKRFHSVVQTEAETWKERGGPWAVQISCRKSESWNRQQVFYLL